jgi:hypothetical protein
MPYIFWILMPPHHKGKIAADINIIRHALFDETANLNSIY